MSTGNGIDEMVNSFKDMAELRLFCESQYKTIVALSKKNADLENLLKKAQSDPNSSGLKSDTILLFKDASDQEIICKIQLKLLKDIALDRELTLEECRKVETYTKVLLSLAPADPNAQDQTQKMDDKELLKMLGIAINDPTV